MSIDELYDDEFMSGACNLALSDTFHHESVQKFLGIQAREENREEHYIPKKISCAHWVVRVDDTQKSVRIHGSRFGFGLEEELE